MEKKTGGSEQICSRKVGKWRCKDMSGDNKFQYCEKHYKAITDSCSKRRLTKKEEEMLKNTSGDGEADIDVGSASVGTKRKIVEGTEESGELDFTDFLTENPPLITSNKMMEKMKLPPDEQRCAITGFGGWRCKNFRMGHGAATDDDDSVPKTKFCEKHYIHRAKYYKNVKKKNLRQLYCCQTDGKRWRCKNLRMGLGAAADDDSIPKSRYCEKHHNCHLKAKQKYFRKRRSGDDESAGCSTATGPVEIRSSKRTKKVSEEDETEEIQPDTLNDICSAKIGTKRKKVQKPERSGDLNSLTKIEESMVELESLEHYKSKCFELSVELEKKNVELETKNVELETKNVEYFILQGKYAELETKKTAAEDEDAVKYWRNKCSDLESLVLRMENENPRMQCGVSRVSNLESLVTRNGKETSISRCEELRNFEKIESEVRCSQNEITETCENQRYKENMSTHNAETSSGRREDSHVDELKADDNKHHKLESEFPKYSALNISSASLHLASGGENIAEGKGWGCSEGTPFQHGSSSQAHLEMSKINFVNLVSDSDDESVDSLGDPMDMLATENWNRNKHEMKWKSEVDMLSSFEEDPDICMRAVCALYRQEISEDEISPKGLVIDSDTLRCTTLAKFLMDNDCKGDLKKSVAELEKFDSKSVGDCKKLVRRYAIYLFDIYKSRKDPFFVPATTASNGDETAK